MRCTDKGCRNQATRFFISVGFDSKIRNTYPRCAGHSENMLHIQRLKSIKTINAGLYRVARKLFVCIEVHES